MWLCSGFQVKLLSDYIGEFGLYKTAQILNRSIHTVKRWSNSGKVYEVRVVGDAYQVWELKEKRSKSCQKNL